ncbi:hypothetical protein ACU686_02070 [Yinghuangia aomiensis]
MCPGWLDGFPVLTVTAPWRSGDVPWNAPAAAYLRHLGAGLREAHGWTGGAERGVPGGVPGGAGRVVDGRDRAAAAEGRLSPER